MVESSVAIAQTKKWIYDVVIGCNFCPFAASVVKQNGIFFQAENSVEVEICLEALMKEVKRLEEDLKIETTFLIFPNGFKHFNEYLKLVSLAETLLIDGGYEGIYQLASFHPLYQFENAKVNDAANYTNRSVYPMLHLLREASIDKALKHYKDPENIPERNINFSREKGLLYMKMLRDNCFG